MLHVSKGGTTLPYLSKQFAVSILQQLFNHCLAAQAIKAFVDLSPELGWIWLSKFAIHVFG